MPRRAAPGHNWLACAFWSVHSLDAASMAQTVMQTRSTRLSETSYRLAGMPPSHRHPLSEVCSRRLVRCQIANPAVRRSAAIVLIAACARFMGAGSYFCPHKAVLQAARALRLQATARKSCTYKMRCACPTFLAMRRHRLSRGHLVSFRDDG